MSLRLIWVYAAKLCNWDGLARAVVFMGRLAALLTFPSFLKESCIWWNSGELHKPSVQVEMEEMPALRRKVLETDVPELI